jgi:hypothetical protein
VGAFFNGVGAPASSMAQPDGTQAAGMIPGDRRLLWSGGRARMQYLDQLMRSAYGRVIAVTDSGTSTAYNYYNASWGILTEMLMTGNFVNLGAL